jgi:hypothetical protein
MKKSLVYLITTAALLMLLLSIATPLAAQDAPPIETTVQLGPESGHSLGLFSRLPTGWTEDHSAAVLAFGNYTGTATGEATFTRSYLWFPLPATPAGYTLQQATVEIYTVADSPFTGSAGFGLYRVAADWSETMDWTARAPLDPAVLASASGSSTFSAGWMKWDATAAVKTWLAGAPNYGVAVAALPDPDAVPALSGNWAAAAQGRLNSDPTLAPRLVLRYSALPTPPPTAAPQPESTQAPTAAPTSTPAPTTIPPLLPETGESLPLLPGALLLLGGILLAGLLIARRK